MDTALPVAGTVLDGPFPSPDVDFNDGSLTEMSSNWSGFTDALSGVSSYEYAVGTTVGGTEVKSWTSTGATTLVTDSVLVLHTGQTYYFNVRATDAAGNTMVTPASSDGQAVLPLLTVTVSGIDIQLGTFNPENNNTQIDTVTVTVSTNAYNGYVIQMYASDFLRSEENPAVVIPDFSAGTYASPAEWSSTGWGFNTDDCDLNGDAFWTGAGCTGNPKYAPITQVESGNVVADHTALVTGATGPVSAEAFVVTLRATTPTTQGVYTYGTSLVFMVVPDS